MAIPNWLNERFEIHKWRHAEAILVNDFPEEWSEILGVLNDFRLCKSWIEVGGGRKSGGAESIDGELLKFGRGEKKFQTAVTVDGTTSEWPTHQVDSRKNRIALEIDCNNKDQFFDRDLNNFRL